MNRYLIIAALLCFPACIAFSQTDSLPDAGRTPSDTLRDAPPKLPPAQPATKAEFVAEDTMAASGDEFQMAKSPLGAVLRSAAIPGWGQFYTEQYWKIPLILGVSGFLVYGWITEHNDYTVYRDLYDANKDLENPQVDLTRTKLYREFYRNRRDTYAWWFGVTYLLQIADAFVDAHLYDFDVSDEVHISFRASPGGSLGLRVSW